jgi:hypothetical protein
MASTKKAILGSGRPLTIACHMKKTYFFRVSVVLAVVSVVEVAPESTLSTVVSGADCVLVAEVSVPSVVFSAESLQAANAPIARINNNFFIVPCLVCLMNDLILIPVVKEGNPVTLEFFKYFFGVHFDRPNC